MVCELYLSKNVIFLKQENRTHNNQSMEIDPEWTHMLELGENNALKKVIKSCTPHVKKKLSEPIIQSEVSQKDKDHYSILTHIYGI